MLIHRRDRALRCRWAARTAAAPRQACVVRGSGNRPWIACWRIGWGPEASGVRKHAAGFTRALRPTLSGGLRLPLAGTRFGPVVAFASHHGTPRRAFPTARPLVAARQAAGTRFGPG